MHSFKRHFTAPVQSFFLFGPRGTGKSIWLKQQYSDALYIDLLETDVLREYIAHPQRLITTVNAYPEKSVVIIDEIQKAPELLSIVHKLIEEKRDKKFILTGSSARKLKNAGVDFLGGRALKMKMHPFMASELEEHFDMYQALKTGLVPLIVSSPDPEKAVKSYIDIYLNEEVKQEGLVRTIGDFSRFLDAAALSHGQVLNVTNVAQDCQVSRKTVESYFTIVKDLLIGDTIDVFTKRAQRAMAAHPKFYFFDCGVYRSLRPKGPLDSPEEIGGAGLESLVYQHLQAWIDYSEIDAKIYCWRTQAGNEVDFVIYGESVFYAIEVKAGGTVKSQHLRGLKTFSADYPQSKPYLLYMGKNRQLIDSILCVPCAEFLQALIPGKEFPFS